MRKVFLITVLLASACAFAFVPGTELSINRIKLADQLFNEIIQDYSAEPETAEIGRVLLEKLQQQDSNLANFNPAVARRGDEDIKINGRARIRATLEATYPIYTDEELDKLASERYPLYQQNAKIDIYYYDYSNHVAKINGYYRGFKAGYANIDNRRINVMDMRNIRVVAKDGSIIDNEEEIIKLNPVLNREKRDELRNDLIEQRNNDRLEWQNDNTAKMMQEQEILEGETNEKNGYTFYQGSWLEPMAFVITFTANEMEIWKQKKAEKERAQLEIETQLADTPINIIRNGENFSPVAKLNFSEKFILSGNNPVYSSIAKANNNEDLNEDESEGDDNEDKDEDDSSDAVSPKHAGGTLGAVIDEAADAPRRINGTIWMIFMAAIILIGVIGILIYRRRHTEEELDVSAFFEGKGDEQKLFWEAADNDPENFHYVAYLFRSQDDASDALNDLSYIFMGEDSRLHSRKNIMYGTFEHKQGVVSYVGGTQLNYALWREASAVWPELPGAKYFKVSQEPQVKLVIPESNTLSSLQILDLGVEDIRGEHGEITRVYRYKAENVNDAITFLEAFDIQEEGIAVNITTPNCKYGKDINGIFEIQDAD